MKNNWLGWILSGIVGFCIGFGSGGSWVGNRMEKANKAEWLNHGTCVSGSEHYEAIVQEVNRALADKNKTINNYGNNLVRFTWLSAADECSTIVGKQVVPVKKTNRAAFWTYSRWGLTVKN